MIVLKKTCSACPEQYDAYVEGMGEIGQVGYLRLRHGYFRVEFPDCGGQLIYQADPKGDGAFDDDERDYYLRFAVDAIERQLRIESQLRDQLRNGDREKPPAPDVQYKVME